MKLQSLAAFVFVLAAPLACTQTGASPPALYGSDNDEPPSKDAAVTRAAPDTALPGKGTPPDTAKPGGAMTKAPLGTGGTDSDASGANVGGASMTDGSGTSSGGTGATGGTTAPSSTGANGGTSP